MGKIIRLIFGLIVFLVFGYLFLRGAASWRQGYSWNEMDWSQKGSTSLADFFAASDIGKRETNVNGVACTEYYAYKDGLPIKMICHK